jgi:hypothetical protein
VNNNCGSKATVANSAVPGRGMKVLSQMGTLLASPGQEIAPDHTAPQGRTRQPFADRGTHVRLRRQGRELRHAVVIGFGRPTADRVHSIDNRICPQRDHVQGTIATVAGL